jgi:regulatory protein
MTERHDAARAALEAALVATSGGPTAPSSGPGATPGRPQSRPAGESDPYDIARQIVLRQLALAPKTRKQLEDKLRQRDCSDDVARVVLDRMAAVGLVDDEAYAGMLVRSQQVGRGLAKRALARELRTKGVDDQIARATLDAIDPEDERERARQLVAKRLRTMHGLDPVVQTRRLAGMLARKGYPPDVSMTVIREAVANAPEHQRD